MNHAFLFKKTMELSKMLLLGLAIFIFSSSSAQLFTVNQFISFAKASSFDEVDSLANAAGYEFSSSEKQDENDRLWYKRGVGADLKMLLFAQNASGHYTVMLTGNNKEQATYTRDELVKNGYKKERESVDSRALTRIFRNGTYRFIIMVEGSDKGGHYSVAITKYP